MSFEILVFSNEILKGEDTFDLLSIQKFFAKVDCHCKELLFLSNNEDEKMWQQISEKIGKENLLIFFKNSNIDQFVMKYFARLGKYQNTILEQALVFEQEDKKCIVLPYDTNYINILEKIITKPVGRKIITLKLFGKKKAEIDETLHDLTSQYPDLKTNYFFENLLTEIYFSYDGEGNAIDAKQVAFVKPFQDCLYSESDLSLQQSIFQLLRLKNLRLSIIDRFTGGVLISSLFDASPNFDEFIKISKVERASSILSKEDVYNCAVSQIKENFGDFIVVVDGKQFENSSEVVFAIADKKEVYMFKNTFSALGQSARIMASNSILYHLYKKLKQNDLIFN